MSCDQFMFIQFTTFMSSFILKLELRSKFDLIQVRVQMLTYIKYGASCLAATALNIAALN